VNWVLFAQLMMMLLAVYLLTVAGCERLIDKKREDAHHRKENGL
jgi:Tfp pilus assembly protein PilO